jgi:NAD(P)-dependent dehydrogenase (short-subunit alcohol dehydrogenase family)
MTKKTVVVTGAAGFLGRRVCARLAEEGWSVAAIDVGASLPEAALQLGGVDLGDPAQAEQALARAAERGPIHGLANIAGGFVWERIAEGSVETWDRLYNLNLRTALNACRAALPRLADGASIVNIGAAAAAKAELGMAAYAASKSAVARLTEGLAAELKPRRIRVNAVLPSIIDTPANRADMPDADFARWVTAEELAEAIAFLLSDRASGITGASIPVTGRV